MDAEFIRKRITQLRLERGVSEYKMSLDLGHSRSYIQSITSGRTMPSMSEFLFICDYLGITPRAFFDADNQNPVLMQKALEGMMSMPDSDMLLLIGLIDRLNKR